MDGGTLSPAHGLSGTTFEVLLRAEIVTRFKVKDRWLIAASCPTEDAARREYGALSREFPAETVSLMLVRSDTDTTDGSLRERILERREGSLAGMPARRRALRPPPIPQPPARSHPIAPAQHIAPSPRPAATAGRATPWMMGALVALAGGVLGFALR